MGMGTCVKRESITHSHWGCSEEKEEERKGGAVRGGGRVSREEEGGAVGGRGSASKGEEGSEACVRRKERSRTRAVCKDFSDEYILKPTAQDISWTLLLEMSNIPIRTS